MFETALTSLPEKERLVKLLKQRGEKGVFVWELIAPRPQGMGIAQYNRAIKELRDGDFDGTHYSIVNVEPGHFVLQDSFELMVRTELFEDKGPVPFGDPTPKQAVTVFWTPVEPPKEWEEARQMVLAKIAQEKRSFR